MWDITEKSENQVDHQNEANEQIKMQWKCREARHTFSNALAH